MGLIPSGSPMTERSATFHVAPADGGAPLFYRPHSRLIRDLGVLALAALGREHRAEPLRVLDAYSGSGVRSLRYAQEAGGASVVGFIHANERMFGSHPLRGNLAQLVGAGRCTITDIDAIDLVLRGKTEGERFDLVDCDGFGTGQPHVGEAWWAVRTGGLLYLCATDSLAAAGRVPHKAASGWAGVAQPFPSCNEQGLRLLLGAAFREAAARNLHAEPAFSYFHPRSSSFRVALRLHAARRPPSSRYDSLAHVARCEQCGELWRVPSPDLGNAAGRRTCEHEGAPVSVAGPMWVGSMHNASLMAEMGADAEARGDEWADAAELLRTFGDEAAAEERGALLFYHLGEVQRELARAGSHEQPPLDALIGELRERGFGASRVHSEKKALKTSATLRQVVEVVGAMRASK